MVSYGNIIKKIRENKNLTQKELADGIVTPQFLSQFENNKFDIKLNNFLMLLDRLNIKYNEFIVNIIETNQPSQKVFFQRYQKAYYSDNKILLKALIEEEKSQYAKNSNYRHLHNTIMLKQRLSLLMKEPYNDNDRKIIINYLKKVYDWGIYEVSLFTNCLFFLNKHDVAYFKEMVINKITKYGSKFKTKGEFSKVLLNLINYSLVNDSLDEIELLISQTEDFLRGDKAFYEKNQLNYLKGLYIIKTGTLKDGMELCDTAIRILTHFGEFEKANHMQNELDSFLIEM